MKIPGIVLIISLITLNVQAQDLKGIFHPQPFVHPGIYQSRADLDFMRAQILAGVEPWKSAFEKLNTPASENFVPKPFTHVIRGSYGSPAIGGAELSASADEAYKQAIEWYVTRDKKHADKAIQIINAWGARLWDFDDNDAKLLAGWTGHLFCSAAEILKYTDAGWQQKDIKQFKQMLMTAYNPLIKDYFPEANGNWDAAMMDTRLAIAVFCDDHIMFDNVMEHYLRGEGNSGITKYIYPGGQCEESTRDQAHTQLGLGYLAQICQIAWTQHIDLYAAADNRLAAGYEFTAKYMLGKDVDAYGIMSAKVRGRFSDIYESVYRHYHDVKGINMPYTAQAADSARKKMGVMLLTSARASLSRSPDKDVSPRVIVGLNHIMAGAQLPPQITLPAKAFKIDINGSLQAALDSAADTGAWILLTKGLYVLPAPLRIPSGVTICGQGKETILFLDPKQNPGKTGAAMVNAAVDLHDVTLRDFVIEGAITPQTATDPNQDRRERSYQMAASRAGIVFLGLYDGQIKDIHISRVTVSNCTKNGVVITGATGITITGCDFSDNGSSVVPGPGIHHNLLLGHVTHVEVTGSRMDTSPWGNGISVIAGKDVIISGNELARNKLSGIYIADSERVTIKNNQAEGNDMSGITLATLSAGNKNIKIENNYLQYNGNEAVETAGLQDVVLSDNTQKGNGQGTISIK